MVMLMAHEGMRMISSPSKLNIFFFYRMADWMVRTCWAMTERTSKSILLNSSKQHQAPELANPLKNFLMAM